MNVSFLPLVYDDNKNERCWWHLCRWNISLCLIFNITGSLTSYSSCWLCLGAITYVYLIHNNCLCSRFCCNLLGVIVVLTSNYLLVQVSLLKKRVNIGSGTPSRIKKLIDIEALGLSRLDMIVLDMHADVKGFSLFTLPQVRFVSPLFTFIIIIIIII